MDLKDIHPPILELALHYAERLGDAAALEILRGAPIGSAERARAFVKFLGAMLDLAIVDEAKGVLVRGRQALAGDAEKAYLALEDAVEASGFGQVLDDLGD